MGMKKLLPLGVAALAAPQLLASPSDARCAEAADNAKWVRPEIGTAYNGRRRIRSDSFSQGRTQGARGGSTAPATAGMTRALQASRRHTFVKEHPFFTAFPDDKNAVTLKRIFANIFHWTQQGK